MNSSFTLSIDILFLVFLITQFLIWLRRYFNWKQPCFLSVILVWVSLLISKVYVLGLSQEVSPDILSMVLSNTWVLSLCEWFFYFNLAILPFMLPSGMTYQSRKILTRVPVIFALVFYSLGIYQVLWMKALVLLIPIGFYIFHIQSYRYLRILFLKFLFFFILSEITRPHEIFSSIMMLVWLFYLGSYLNLFSLKFYVEQRVESESSYV